MKITHHPVDYARLKQDGHEAVMLEIGDPSAVLVRGPEGPVWHSCAVGTTAVRVPIYHYHPELPYLWQLFLVEQMTQIWDSLGTPLSRVAELHVVVSGEPLGQFLGFGIRFHG